MQLSPIALVLVALLLAAWTVGAAWVALSARARERRSEADRANVRRLGRMIETSPAVPLLVRSDGRIEGSRRIASWLGLDALPDFLSELGEGDIAPESVEALRDAVRRTQKTAAAFHIELTVRKSASDRSAFDQAETSGADNGARSLAVMGQLADPGIAPSGAVLLWWFDFSESQGELARLQSEAANAKADFAALVGIIEAAPVPMWFRGADMQLRLVNRAYAIAVGAEDGRRVVEQQIELIEPVEGVTPVGAAYHAFETGRPISRILQATLGSQRRTVRVSDLPLGSEGVAGFAIDIEEQEEQTRALRAFREAQRSMLDCLSAGVAQFDAEHRLTFANQHFRRLFSLPEGAEVEDLAFDRFLDHTRAAGRLPETRDFPAWRRELIGWFTASEPVRSDWPLTEGVHLKVIAHPMPDGALILLVEDRSEQLAVSAMRDTLLRTRGAMIDALSEGLAVFGPDGHLQLYNRSFPALWRMDEDFLTSYPRIETVVEQIGSQLARTGQRTVIEEIVREATLDRKERRGRVLLADGRTIRVAGMPLPDGNGLLTVLDVTENTLREGVLRERSRALEEKTPGQSELTPTHEPAGTGSAFPAQAPILDDAEPSQSEVLDQHALDAAHAATSGMPEHAGEPDDHVGPEEIIEEKPVELFPLIANLVRSREKEIVDGQLSVDLRGDHTAGFIELGADKIEQALSELIDLFIATLKPGGRIFMTLARPSHGARIIISGTGKEMELVELIEASNKQSADEAGIPQIRGMIEALGGRLEIRLENTRRAIVSVFL